MTAPKATPIARPLAWPIKLTLGCVVALGIAAAAARRHGDLLDQPDEDLAPLGVNRPFLPLDR